MDTLEPWNDFSRDRLPPGWTYPLGRNEFRQALASRQARLWKMSLVRLRPKEPEPVYLLVVDWFSDARPGSVWDPDWIPLRIMHYAVPVFLAGRISGELKSRWLDEAADWTKAAPERGNAWTASDHSWVLTYTSKDGITLTES